MRYHEEMTIFTLSSELQNNCPQIFGHTNHMTMSDLEMLAWVFPQKTRTMEHVEDVIKIICCYKNRVTEILTN